MGDMTLRDRFGSQRNKIAPPKFFALQISLAQKNCAQQLNYFFRGRLFVLGAIDILPFAIAAFAPLNYDILNLKSQLGGEPRYVGNSAR